MTTNESRFSISNMGKVEEIWGSLTATWAKINDDKSPNTWIKKCPLFDVFIAEFINGYYEFAIECGDAAHLIEQKMTAHTLDEAIIEADKLVVEFIEIGLDKLNKLDSIRLPTHSEIRLVNIATYQDTLVGLDDCGIVYRQTQPNGAWNKVSMRKANGS